MTYGVKVIHTITVGENDQRYYEELILRVEADSFDNAYEKAESYMKDAACEYKNPKGDTVKTLCIEAVDYFLALCRRRTPPFAECGVKLSVINIVVYFLVVLTLTRPYSTLRGFCLSACLIIEKPRNCFQFRGNFVRLEDYS